MESLSDSNLKVNCIKVKKRNYSVMIRQQYICHYNYSLG